MYAGFLWTGLSCKNGVFYRLTQPITPKLGDIWPHYRERETLMPAATGHSRGVGSLDISSSAYVGDIADAELHLLVAAAEAAHAKGAVRRSSIRL